MLLTSLMGNMELLCMQCSGVGPHLAARGKSHGFSRVAAGTWCPFLSYGGDDHSKLLFVLLRQNSFLVTRETSGISTRFGGAIRMLLKVRPETECSLLVPTVILGFLSIFNKSQASSPFETLNSAFLSRCQRNVRPPVQMMWGPNSFYRVSTGNSDIPSSCVMKHEPAFKPMQQNPAFI